MVVQHFSSFFLTILLGNVSPLTCAILAPCACACDWESKKVSFRHRFFARHHLYPSVYPCGLMSLAGGSVGYSLNMDPEMAGRLQKIPTSDIMAPSHSSVQASRLSWWQLNTKTLGIKRLTTFSDYRPLHRGFSLYAADDSDDSDFAFPFVQDRYHSSHEFSPNPSSLKQQVKYIWYFVILWDFLSPFPTSTSWVWKDNSWSVTVVKVAMTGQPWSASLVPLWVTPLFGLTVVGQQLCLLPFSYAGSAHWSIHKNVGYVCWIHIQGPFYLWAGQCLHVTAVYFMSVNILTLQLLEKMTIPKLCFFCLFSKIVFSYLFGIVHLSCFLQTAATCMTEAG